jgi:hypothetical protein
MRSREQRLRCSNGKSRASAPAAINPSFGPAGCAVSDHAAQTLCRFCIRRSGRETIGL